MSDVDEPLTLDYFTDMLCVWAWIAERRVEELEHQWGEKIRVRHHCVNVFGDTAAKMARQWASRGGFDGFAEHVHESAAAYETAMVHPDLWRKVRPATSANAHLLLKAAEIVDSADAMITMASRIRRAFFVDAVEVGLLPALLEVATDAGLDAASLNEAILSGRAPAALLSDYTMAEEQGIKGSPSWRMNQGRQVLYGNVGYRILHANVEELLKHPEQEASWC